MVYLIISLNGLSFFVVSRLNKEASVEKVFFTVPTPDSKHYGSGLNQLPEYSKLEIVQDYNYVLNRYSPGDLTVVVDDVGLGETASHIRKMGYKVVGGGVLAERLERDRTFATNLMKKVMNVPETETFTSFEEGLGFLKAQDKAERFVFKPNDEDTPKEYTYVSKDVADMVDSIKEFQSEWKWKEDFQLQKFVKGYEVDFNAYFNGKDYLPNSMMIYFENKPVMNDDIGPAGGGAIAVQFTRPVKGLFGDILNKMKPLLIKDGYVGQIAINSMVSEADHKPYFLEFTNRFGYPSFQMDITMLEDNGKSLHQLLQALAQGTNSDLFPKNKVAVVVSVGVSPYPSKDGNEKLKGTPMKWSKKWDEYFFPSYIMYDKKKGIVLAGISSECMQVTCVAENIDGATQMLYDQYMPTLRLKNKMYRTDLGFSAKKRLSKIKDWELF